MGFTACLLRRIPLNSWVLANVEQCTPIKTFGKCHLDDVLSQVNTTETIAQWCAVDTTTGTLTCVLEELYCFDAEMYADELDAEESVYFKEDQRSMSTILFPAHDVVVRSQSFTAP